MTLFFGAPKDYTFIPGQNCPYCGYYFDCATGLEENSTPQPGAISLCLRCMEIGIYDENMIMRKATPEELEEIRNTDAERKIILAQNKTRFMRRGRG